MVGLFTAKDQFCMKKIPVPLTFADRTGKDYLWEAIGSLHGQHEPDEPMIHLVDSTFS